MEQLILLFNFIGVAFSIWMAVDCIRRKSNVFTWLITIFLLPIPLGGIIYYFKFKPLIFAFPKLQPVHSESESDAIRDLKAQVNLIGSAHQYEQLGFEYLKEHKFDSAKKSFKKALEKNKNSLNSKYGMSKALFHLEKFSEASKILKEIVDIEPNFDYGYAMFGLAEAYKLDKKDEEALRVYEKVHNSSSFFKASVRYAELLKKNNQVTKAIEVMQSIVTGAEKLPTYKYRQEIEWIEKAKTFVAKHSN